MGLEDKHLDILQNIEYGIATTYREDPSVRDMDVIKALDALSRYYLQKNMGKNPELPDLEDKSMAIFDTVVQILKNRQKKLGKEEPKRPRFSRALREPTQNEIFLACIRKLGKSAKRWNKRDGERGYLDFIDNFIQ